MNKQAIRTAYLVGYLTYGLQEGLRLDIARGASDLRDDNIRLRLLLYRIDKGFDLIRDMGNHLYGLSQVFSPALLFQHIPVYLSRGQIGKLVQILVDKAFVMSQIQVRLRAVLRHEHLSMLIGTHGTRIDIDIRIQLLRRDLKPSCLQESTQRSRRDSFSQPRYYAASYKYKLRHRLISSSFL